MEQSQWTNSQPIDLVIPYVDSADPLWKSDFRRMLTKQIGGNSPQRYRGNGLFKYFFRGVCQNMPWIRTIHVVLARPSQLPKWLNTNNPKIHVVYHKDYIPATELPTFNSNVIEMFYHKIPGLSENFIIANDDFYVLHPASEYDFFRNDKPVDTAILAADDYKKKGLVYNFRCTLWHNNTLLCKLLKVPKVPSYKIFHAFTPMKKSTYEYVWQKCGKDLMEGIHRSAFRLSRNFTWHLFRAYRLYKKDYIEDGSVVHDYKYTEIKVFKDIEKVTFDSTYLCLNDKAGMQAERTFGAIRQKFNRFFPTDCQYEKTVIDTSARKIIGSPKRMEDSYNEFMCLSKEELAEKYKNPEKFDYVVSFTSFGRRLKYVPIMVFSYVVLKRKNMRLCLTIYKDDYKNIPPDLMRLIDAGIVELLISDVDYGPHLKYVVAMDCYYDKPIITIDDDRYCSNTTFDGLIRVYERTKFKTVISNCSIKMQKEGAGLAPLKKWQASRQDPNTTSFIGMAEGFAGVLYPPKCFEDFENHKKEIIECKYDDDLFLKVREIEAGIPVTTTSMVDVHEGSTQIRAMLPWNLHKNVNSNASDNRNKMIRKFAKRLLKGFQL